MLSTADLLEIMQIINCEHADPHHILGMHKIKQNSQDCLAIRVFNPQAARIWIVDPKEPNKKQKLIKIHEHGFFEAVLKDKKTWFRYMLILEGFDGTKWETYDAYSFEPQISQLDLYLFGEGTHYKIFDKFGAHPMVVDGVSGVSFAVWAPNAKRVSVIGSFNNWDGRRHPMRALQNSGVWEIFIPNIKQNDHYKFEIKTLNNDILEKSDPYGNFFELRPSKSSLVFDINNYKWNDDIWIQNRKAEEQINIPINIYEVHLGSWMRIVEDNNRFLSYVELAEKLIPYVKDMGYTHIELMPVLEHPFDGSWGYQVTGYYAPTSRYGDPSEFMYFVDMCHKNNIGVLLDWVPAHFPKDAHGLAKFDGTALYEHEDPRMGEHPHWGTLIFNYGRKEVKNFLIANAIFWIEKFHIDGLRVDAVASMLYLDYGKNAGEWVPNIHGGRENYEAVEFMKHMNSIIKGLNQNVLMIAEESTSWAGVSRKVENGGLGFDLKWNMGWMNDFLKYIEKESIYRKYHHSNLTFSMVYAYTENFVLVLSHDEVVHGKGSLIGKMPGDLWQKFANLRLSYGFMFAHPGKKLIFMGGEFAQYSEWSEENSLQWHLLENPENKNIQTYLRDLNMLYKNEKALWTYDFDDRGFCWIACDDADKSEVSFIRKTKNIEDTLVIVCNFTPVTLSNHRIGVPYETSYREIFNSDSAKYGGSGITNDSPIMFEDQVYNNFDSSIVLKVPPLGITILKPIF